MADYKELLRRAVEALPENNGAARRAVYEKARAALVGQLRAIQPPLPARDITAHRLQLEDCIRQVEQEASEAVIAGMAGQADTPPPPVYFENGANRPHAGSAKPQQAAAKPAAKAPGGGKEPPKALPQGETIEDIIAAANAESAPAEPLKKGRAAAKPAEPKSAAKPIPMRAVAPPRPATDDGDEGVAGEEAEADILPPRPAPKPTRPLPAIVARAEAAKSRSNSTAFGVPNEKPYDAPRRGPTIEPRTDVRVAARGGQAAVARQPAVEPVAFLEEPKVVAAMSAVREVEVEPQPVDPQGAIDRAIATLDREARGDHEPVIDDAANDHDDEDARPNGKARGRGIGSMLGRPNGAANPQVQPRVAANRLALPAAAKAAPGGRARRDARDRGLEAGFPRARAERERGGLGAVTIFLIVFAVLLMGAGGAGFWAVTQGYLDLSSMFRGGQQQAEAATTPPAPVTANVTAEATPATGPGNTAAPEQQAPAAELATEERLTPDPALTGSEPLALAATPAPANEERLSTDAAEATAEAAVGAVDPASVAGSQSLLLEASDDGTTGAVPFSGTVEWTRGTDEMGQPTLVGKANIPARNLSVDVLIRKNADPSLPASHLMEINFHVTDSFIGGSIAGLPGVLLKNEELVQGTPLVGASARVVGNSFLFALSASPEDLANNSQLLTGRKWMDLALIYATGKRAIITLEKDSDAQNLFAEVFADWTKTASN